MPHTDSDNVDDPHTLLRRALNQAEQQACAVRPAELAPDPRAPTTTCARCSAT